MTLMMEYRKAAKLCIIQVIAGFILSGVNNGKMHFLACINSIAHWVSGWFW